MRGVCPCRMSSASYQDFFLLRTIFKTKTPMLITFWGSFIKPFLTRAIFQTIKNRHDKSRALELRSAKIRPDGRLLSGHMVSGSPVVVHLAPVSHRRFL